MTDGKQRCPACGVPFLKHNGLIPTCKELQRIKTYFESLRPFTRWAAGQLELTLLYNDRRGKGAWETCHPLKLIAKIDEEFQEVKDACAECCLEERRTSKAILHLQSELSDLAVTCFMLSSIFDAEMSGLRRGRLPE